jgi:hypothetical protein
MKTSDKNLGNSRQTLHKVFLLLTLAGLILIMIILTRYATRSTSSQPFIEIMSHSSKNNTPNWRGIEPSKTTEPELDTIISKTPDVFEDLTKRQLRPEGVRYIWYDTEFQLSIGVTFHEGVASYLHFNLPGYSPFMDFLRIAGSPTAYFASSITEEFVHIVFLYEELGVVISFYAEFDPSEIIGMRRHCAFTLTERTRVENVKIYFTEQKNLDSMVATPFLRPFILGEIPVLWTGIEEALKLTSGQTSLNDGTQIDCRSP